MQLTALKAEVATLKAQPRPIRGPYKRRATVLQPVEVGAVVAAQPSEPLRKSVKVARRAAASGSGAAAASVPQPPRRRTISELDLHATLATLHTIHAGMGQLKEMREGELYQLKTMLLPHAKTLWQR